MTLLQHIAAANADGDRPTVQDLADGADGGTMLILLSAFNAPRVLAGARVKLRPAEADTGRWEWCDDLLIRVSRSPEGILFTPYAQIVGNWEFLGLALDPTDADTARLIDRRVAEAQFKQPMPDIVFTLAVHTDRLGRQHFALAGMDNQGQGYLSHVAAFPVSVGDLLADLPSLAANLPEARARLLCALYPPVPA